MDWDGSGSGAREYEEVWETYPAQEGDREPCCIVTEGAWTWFGCIVFTLALLAIFNLRYYRKRVRRPQNLRKERTERVLRRYLLAHQRAATTDLPSGSLSIQEFTACCAERRKLPIIFKIEYSEALAAAAETGQQQAQLAGRLPANLSRNRNQDVVPFDANRVKLCGGEDYVNASYCQGLLPHTSYILTQGPLESTVCDFWRMVWEQEAPAIVMLTKNFDLIRVMCVQYWPRLGCEEQYGEILVRMVKEVRYANYIQRHLTLTKNSEQRDTIQFQYTEWACYGAPVKETLLEMRRRVAATMEDSKLKGPCVVHCHDGAGRSGVYIIMDANIRLMDRESRVEIYSYLPRLRRERPGLVASLEQYIMVYDLLQHHLLKGSTIRGKRELLQWLLESGEEGLRAEFELVNRLVLKLHQGECAAGHRVDNRHKNRQALLVPPDAHRPYISSFQGNDCTDYINAVFVDGYLRSHEFIVTEWPLQHTLPDLWSMVWDHEVKTVVVLDRPKQSTKFPAMWPEPGKKTTFGPVFSVERLKGSGREEAEESRHYQTCTLVISKKELAPHRKIQALHVDENQGKQLASLTSLVVGLTNPPRRCRLIHLQAWPDGVLDVMTVARETGGGAEEPPVLVISADGVSRAGVYCALSYVRDQTERGENVDMVQAASTVRTNRPQLLGTLAEYQLAYSLLHQLLT